MHRNYATIVRPVLDGLEPRSIALVGGADGHLAHRLLRDPAAARAHLHVVGAQAARPAAPGVQDGRVTVHHATGAEALGDIGPADLLLVDDDPNWHTVTAALAAGAGAARRGGGDPPLALVHNVHWPFGRRDGYRDPERVPAGARQPYTAAGLEPARSAPVPDGLRLAPCVAVRDHGDRNGVLTAAEAFARDDADDWELVDVPGFGGTALLVAARRLERAPRLRGVVDALRSADGLRRAARRAEAGRLAAELALARSAPATDAERTAAAEDELAWLRDRWREREGEERELLELRARHAADQWRIEALERDLSTRERERREARDAHAQQLETQARSLAERDRGHAAQAARTSADRSALAAQETRLADLTRAETLLQARVQELQDTLRAASGELEAQRHARERSDAALDDALVDLREVAVQLLAARGTRRARAAHGVRGAWRRSGLGRDEPTALDRALAVAGRRRALPAAADDDDPGAAVPARAERD